MSKKQRAHNSINDLHNRIVLTPKTIKIFWAMKKLLLEQTEIVKCLPSKVIETEKTLGIKKGKRIGSGAFGFVFEGRSVRGGEGRKLAVKVYNAFQVRPGKSRQFGIEDLSSISSARKLLVESLQEIIIMKALKDHPNFVTYVRHFMINDDIYLIMELEDDTLNRQLKHYPNGMEEAKAQKWFFDIAQAVCYLHEIGVMHLDMDSDNVLIRQLPDKTTVCKITDFGQSRFLPHVKSDLSFWRDKLDTTGTDLQDPQVTRLIDLFTIPDDIILLAQEEGDSANGDLYYLGIILLEMFGVANKAIMNTVYTILETRKGQFMAIQPKAIKTQLSHEAKDILWELIQEKPRITTIRRSDKDGFQKLPEHPWFSSPGEEPGLKPSRKSGPKYK